MLNSTTINSKAEYLKRYMSKSLGDQPQKKKKKAAVAAAAVTTKGRGMRLLDDDTFGQSHHPTHGNKHLRRPADSDQEEDDDDDDDELDEIERAVRELNRKSAAARQKKTDNGDGPSFKTDSFVTVEGPSEADVDATKQQQECSRNKQVKKEIKEEIPSEDEGQSNKETRASRHRNKMNDGRKAGLVTKETMAEEIRELQERKKAATTAAEADGSNRQAEGETRQRVTGFKRRSGRRGKADNDAESAARKQREAAKQLELEQKYQKWNKGVSQLREREERLEQMEQTLAEGFTRHADDKAMNEHLREQLHGEDPMAEYFRVKNHKVQMRTGVVYPTYKGQYPLNRFDIPPGYRWDGVDRSGGFEAKLALEKNKRTAREELAYRSIAECEQ